MSKEIMHRTPEYREDGSIVGVRYFSTRNETKAFAKAQCKKRGGKGWSMESLDREYVAELLTSHAPPPKHWGVLKRSLLQRIIALVKGGK